MTLKELNQAFWLQQEIAGLSRQLEEMRERASTIPSAGFDNMPHGLSLIHISEPTRH